MVFSMHLLVHLAIVESLIDRAYLFSLLYYRFTSFLSISLPSVLVSTLCLSFFISIFFCSLIYSIFPIHLLFFSPFLPSLLSFFFFSLRIYFSMLLPDNVFATFYTNLIYRINTYMVLVWHRWVNVSVIFSRKTILSRCIVREREKERERERAVVDLAK